MTGLEVLFIDTSILCNLLAVPGRSDRAEEVQEQFKKYIEEGKRFVLPITAIIETGNLIQQCRDGRRAAAERFAAALKRAVKENPPWVIHRMKWDQQFISALIDGDSTGMGLVDHFDKRLLGAGDLSILVERDLYAAKIALRSVRIWTIDKSLDVYQDSPGKSGDLLR